MKTDMSRKKEVVLGSHGNSRGSLLVGESGREIPFLIKRFFVIKDVPSGATRGAHAHKTTSQALFCLCGSFTLITDDGVSVIEESIDSHSTGRLLLPKVWHTMKDFSKGTIALVVANKHYRESDYVRDYEGFLRLVKKGT